MEGKDLICMKGAPEPVFPLSLSWTVFWVWYPSYVPDVWNRVFESVITNIFGCRLDWLVVPASSIMQDHNTTCWNISCLTVSGFLQTQTKSPTLCDTVHSNGSAVIIWVSSGLPFHFSPKRSFGREVLNSNSIFLKNAIGGTLHKHVHYC